jgi:hypothetical protein
MGEAISPQALSELIGSIYDCALDPGHWDQTLGDLRDAFNGQATQIALLDLRRGRFLFDKNVGMKPEQLEIQARYAPEINALLADWFGRNSLDEPHVLSRHLEPSDWDTSPYFRHARSMGFIDMCSYVLVSSPDHFSGFGTSRLEHQGTLPRTTSRSASCYYPICAAPSRLAKCSTRAPLRRRGWRRRSMR